MVLTPRMRERLPYIKVWQRALLATDLPKMTKLVALVLAVNFNGEHGHTLHREDGAAPSAQRLAADAGVNRTTVLKALDELRDAGWVTFRPSRGRVPHDAWQLIIPARATVSATDGSSQQPSVPAAQRSAPLSPTVAPTFSNGRPRRLGGYAEQKGSGAQRSVPPTVDAADRSEVAMPTHDRFGDPIDDGVVTADQLAELVRSHRSVKQITADGDVLVDGHGWCDSIRDAAHVLGITDGAAA